MKNQFPILLFSLLGLCVCAVILLVVVIIKTGGPFSSKTRPVSHTTITSEAATDLPAHSTKTTTPVPDSSLTALPDTSIPSGAPASQSPAVSSVQRYFSTFPCNQMINGTDLKLLLADNNLFCKKSRWSANWANPRGRGLRRRKEGLLFSDSTVTDSFTNIMWQRHASPPKYRYRSAATYINKLNQISWQGYSNWRIPKIEELMATIIPVKNRAGLYFPKQWNCRAKDIWSCNWATDSLNTRWIWVARTALGRCNVGHPDTLRSCIAVRDL